ncbi:MAG TPA: phosphoribosylaminoimidazolesuccinocarboxamide synthase [Rectinemataceae bacterium]|nr:phosphoribosylaminoimidazolesuccinocarboxamide synthase [Rectinemataceae bacterium]
MILKEDIGARLGTSFDSLPEAAACGLPVYRGKVRDVVRGKDLLLLVASDRISAFDRVLSTVPFKGEILARVSAWWFSRCADIVANHVVQGGTPEELGGTGRACLVRRAEMIPVEVVVRGYLAGSAWRDYHEGRPVSGIELPEGLSMNEKFPVPLITPSTKEEGAHDRPLSREEIVAEGILEEDRWAEIERVSVALFRRGQELAARAGLILVDTKYEFGILDGGLVLADEIHSPDSSRYWWEDSYETLFLAKESQRELDKEPFRRWLLAQGFRGEGPAPAIPDEVRVETAWRYIQAYEAITGEEFRPLSSDPQSESAELARIVSERLR